MDKQKVVKTLKGLYKKALAEKEYRLCLDILHEIIVVNNLIEIVA